MISEEYKNKLMQDFQGSKRGGWSTGFHLEELTNELAKTIPNEVVKIIIPSDNSNTFNCYGKAIDIDHDVVGTMPATYLYGDRSKCIEQEDATTLFWGTEKVTKFHFIPFYAEVSCYNIDSIEGNTIQLAEDISWRAFI